MAKLWSIILANVSLFSLANYLKVYNKTYSIYDVNF